LDDDAPEGCELIELVAPIESYRRGEPGRLVARAPLVPQNRLANAVGLGFFAALGVALLLPAVVLVADSGASLDWMAVCVLVCVSIVELAVVAGLVFMAPAVALDSRRRVTVRIDQGRLTRRHEPLDWPASRAVALDPGLEIVASTRSDGTGYVRVGDEDAPRLLVVRLPSPAHAEWLAERIRRVL